MILLLCEASSQRTKKYVVEFGWPLAARRSDARDSFGGGILALDGLHPTNTGYAIIANAWIATINTAYGTSIPAVNVNAIYATDPYAPH